MTKEEIVEIMEHYINDIGKFYHFKEWIEKQGYTLEELGFKDED